MKTYDYSVMATQTRNNYQKFLKFNKNRLLITTVPMSSIILDCHWCDSEYNIIYAKYIILLGKRIENPNNPGTYITDNSQLTILLKDVQGVNYQKENIDKLALSLTNAIGWKLEDDGDIYLYFRSAGSGSKFNVSAISHNNVYAEFVYAQENSDYTTKSDINLHYVDVASITNTNASTVLNSYINNLNLDITNNGSTITQVYLQQGKYYKIVNNKTDIIYRYYIIMPTQGNVFSISYNKNTNNGSVKYICGNSGSIIIKAVVIKSKLYIYLRNNSVTYPIILYSMPVANLSVTELDTPDSDYSDETATVIADNIFYTAGPSSKRPNDTYVGFKYFDTTINKPIFVKSVDYSEHTTVWVDAMGTEV